MNATWKTTMPCGLKTHTTKVGLPYTAEGKPAIRMNSAIKIPTYSRSPGSNIAPNRLSPLLLRKNQNLAGTKSLRITANQRLVQL